MTNAGVTDQNTEHHNDRPRCATANTTANTNNSLDEELNVSNPLGNFNFNFNIDLNEFDILPKITDKLLIDENVCLTCSKGCEKQTLTCYICQLTVHYCCYPTESEGKPLARGNFENLAKFKRHKWFCKDCEQVDISSHVKKQLYTV